MNLNLGEMTPQEVFDSIVYAKPDVMRAVILGFSGVAQHMDHIVEHGMYPDKYWDDVQELAKERDFEFVHPKYTKGPALVKDSKTVH